MKTTIAGAKFTLFPEASAIDAETLDGCSELFSAHYGVWGRGAKRPPGTPVALSPARLRFQCLWDAERCGLVTARIEKTENNSENEGEERELLIGHAFFCRFPFRNGVVLWITQLVVHREWRSRGLATALLAKAFTVFPGALAWGLVSAHPHAVRALERATARSCIPAQIAPLARELIAASGVPYVRDCELQIHEDGGDSPRQGKGKCCLINTKFFVDHSEVNNLVAAEQKQKSSSGEAGEWMLGELAEGHEFFAFTFSDELKE